MYARVTLFEIDTMRIGVEAALEQFKQAVLPELRKQTGYLGLYVLLSPEGRGELMSLWSSQEAAEAGLLSGYYAEQVEKFVAFYRAPPGREHYDVAFSELVGQPAPAG